MLIRVNWMRPLQHRGPVLAGRRRQQRDVCAFQRAPTTQMSHLRSPLRNSSEAAHLSSNFGVCSANDDSGFGGNGAERGGVG